MCKGTHIFLKLATFAIKLFYLFCLAVAKPNYPFSIVHFCCVSSAVCLHDLQSAFASAQGCTASPILFFISLSIGFLYILFSFSTLTNLPSNSTMHVVGQREGD